MSAAGTGNLVALFKIDSTGAQASMTAAEVSVAKALESMKRQFVAVSTRVKELESGTKSLNSGSTMARATQEVVKYGQAAELSARQQARAFQMLPAQISDIGVGLASGQNPMLILIQQGSQIKDMFGGFGGAARALMSYVTPLNAALAATAGAVVAVGYAMAETMNNNKAFANGLVLTGNAAGLTEDSMRSMAERVHATARITVGSARDILQALANTGRFGPEEIEKVAVGVQRMANVTGESADKMIERFAGLNDGVVKWALEQNKQLNFMTPALYAAAKAAEDMGNKSAALNMVLDAMNTRLETGASAWDRIKEGMKAAANFALGPARALAGAFSEDTPGERLAAVQSRIAILREFEGRRAAAGVSFQNPELARLLEQERLLKRARDAQDSGARDAAQSVVANREAIEARRVLDAVLETEKSQRRMNEEVAKTVAMFKKVEEQGVPYTKEEQDRILAAVRKKYAPPKTLQSKETSGLMPIYATEGAFNAATAVEYENEALKAISKARAEAAKTDAKQRADAWAIEKQNIMQMYRDEIEMSEKSIADAKKKQKELAKHGQEQIKTFEDSVMHLVKNGKDGFRDLFATMAEEAIRGMIRMAAQQALLGKNGEFLGWGQGLQNAWSGLSSFFGGGATSFQPGGFAGGLDYVPYDGFPAVLHKGERVQRSVEASSDRSRGSAGGLVQNNDQRVIVQGDVGAKAMRAIRQGQAMQAARLAYAERY